MGPGLKPGALCSVPAPPGLVEGQDNCSHVAEPQLHLLQKGKCCPAYFTGGFKSLVKERVGRGGVL